MTNSRPIVLVLGLALAACGTPEGPATKTAPAPAPPIAKAPEPAAAGGSAPSTTTSPAAKSANPMVAANALFEAEKYAESAKAFEAITRAEPKNGEAWFKLGYSLLATGQVDASIAANTKAAEFPPQRPTALYNLGCGQALKGNADAAFDALNKSIDSGFDKLSQLEGDTDLKSLRADARYAALVERLTPKPKPKA